MKSLALWLEKIIANLVASIMLAIVVMVLWQVFSRYVLQAPSSVSEEISRFLLIWLGILGAAYGYSRDAHLSLDLFVSKMSAAKQKAIAYLVHLLILSFSIVVFVLGGIKLVFITLEPVQTSAVLGIDVAIVYAILPISGVLFCVLAMNKMYLMHKGLATYAIQPEQTPSTKRRD